MTTASMAPVPDAVRKTQREPSGACSKSSIARSHLKTTSENSGVRKYGAPWPATESTSSGLITGPTVKFSILFASSNLTIHHDMRPPKAHFPRNGPKREQRAE